MRWANKNGGAKEAPKFGEQHQDVELGEQQQAPSTNMAQGPLGPCVMLDRVRNDPVGGPESKTME